MATAKKAVAKKAPAKKVEVKTEKQKIAEALSRKGFKDIAVQTDKMKPSAFASEQGKAKRLRQKIDIDKTATRAKIIQSRNAKKDEKMTAFIKRGVLKPN